MDAPRHQEQYTQMEANFAEKGFNTSGIQTVRKFYNGLDPGETPQPLHYAEILPKYAVTLLVIPLMEFNTLTLALEELSRAVIDALPSGTKVYMNPRGLLHITLFHASHPHDTRPNPIDPTGGCDTSKPSSERTAPELDALSNEQQILKKIVNSTEPPQLVIHSALMADSGTLLLTWTDATENIKEVREAAYKAFPGRPTRQTNIVHSSLCRVLDPVDLDAETIAKVCQVCEDWTKNWTGKVFVPSLTWLVYEDVFSIIYGQRFEFKFAEVGTIDEAIEKLKAASLKE